MKRKTYNNVLKAIRLLQKKGYDFDESSKIAIRIFDEHENDVMPIEFYLDMVISKAEWLEQIKKVM